jgi:triosephosphate isomerase
MIAGNWKMNTTVDEAVNLATALRSGLEPYTHVDRVLCPPFVSLVPVREVLRGSQVRLGAQNLYYESEGAYTGEISPLMLSGLCEFVIIGHSERRHYFAENGDVIKRKLSAALATGLRPILCVGEKLEDNEAGLTESVLTGQLEAALDGIEVTANVIVAYEPIWAIGTGRAATGEQANTTIGFIRRQVASLSGCTDFRILYGGSVTAANTTEFLEQPEIDGALVGGASLKADDFIGIVRQTAEIR